MPALLALPVGVKAVFFRSLNSSSVTVTTVLFPAVSVLRIKRLFSTFFSIHVLSSLSRSMAFSLDLQSQFFYLSKASGKGVFAEKLQNFVGCFST